MTTTASSSKPPRPIHVTSKPTTTTTTTQSSSSSSHSAAAAAGGGGGGGHGQACAACKYRRRKCTPDCLLAPYFPADQQSVFLHALRLFGVSNIQKTLQNTAPELHAEAMRALIFESEARALNPVGGCVCILADLDAQLRAAQSELDDLLRYLDLCRQQPQAVAGAGAADDAAMLVAAGSAPDQDDVSMSALYAADQETASQTGGGVHDHFFDDDHSDQPSAQQIYNYFYDGTAESSSHAWSTVDDHLQKQHHGDGGGGLHVNKAGSPPLSSLGEQLQRHCQLDEPFARVFNVKQELPAVMMEHDGAVACGDDQAEKVVAMAAVENAQIGRQKAPHCQLELGFSSF